MMKETPPDEEADDNDEEDDDEDDSLDYNDDTFQKPGNGLCLELFHGRKTLDEELDDWGPQGPILGPFPYMHVTYGGDLRIDATEDTYIVITDGMIYYDGWYYGDWTICAEAAVRALGHKITPFNRLLQVPPNVSQPAP